MQAWERRAQDGDSWKLDDPGVSGKLQSAEGKRASRNRARAHCGVQHFECGAVHPGSFGGRRIKVCADDGVEVYEGTESVWQADWRVRVDEGKTSGDGDPDLRGGVDGVPEFGEYRVGNGGGRGFGWGPLADRGK